MKSPSPPHLPVELWVEILDWLLFDPDLVDPNPYYPGCNVHFAIQRWNDIQRFRQVHDQRAVLRLVCKAWKTLADSNRCRFWEGGSLTDPGIQWKSATRVQITSQQPDGYCDCVKRCHCPDIGDRNSMEQMYAETLLPRLFQLDSPEELPVRILQMPMSPSLLREKDEQKLKHLQHLFGNVEALRLTTPYMDHMAKFIMRVFPNLVYLNICVTDGYFNPANFNPVHLPLVETLVIYGSAEGFGYSVKGWTFPRLRNLELYVDDFFTTQQPASILQFLGECGRRLQTFRFLRFDPVILPETFWDQVPQLTYLGMTYMSRTPSKPPPHGHPLKRIGILDERTVTTTPSALMKFLDSVTKLEAVAGIHYWENIPAQETIASGKYRIHKHEGKPCYICVDILHAYCSRRGWRYEDYRGRTWEEYRAQTSEE